MDEKIEYVKFLMKAQNEMLKILSDNKESENTRIVKYLKVVSYLNVSALFEDIMDTLDKFIDEQFAKNAKRFSNFAEEIGDKYEH